METNKRPFQRHFSYKHPTFGTKNRPKPESAWRKSVYYWWWAYLRRNEDYIACCANGGSGKMAALYADFGDVRGENFKEWWKDGRGARLFAEPRAEDSFRVLQAAEVVSGHAGTLVVSFPLNLPKKFLEKRFKELLAIHIDRKRGSQLAKESNAKYRFNGQPNPEALELTMKIYDYRAANPDMTLWEVGNSSSLINDDLKLENGDTVSTAQHKKLVLASTVSRYLKRYREYVEATGRGCFLSAKKSVV